MTDTPRTYSVSGNTADPKQIRRDFYRLALDWVHLHQHLPKPIQGAITRLPSYRNYGHPREWASDKAAQIAEVLHDWHDLMAQHRGERKPPAPSTAEQTRVVKAWQYLEPRIEQLCTLVEPEALAEIRTIHHSIRAALGANNPKQLLPIPCPSDECGLRTLTRTVTVGKDVIECGSCGYTVPETYYPLFVRMALETALAQAGDTPPTVVS